MGDLKIFDLSEISKNNNSNLFVETGTFKGDGVRHAQSCNAFDEIHSIEILESLANEAKNNFQFDKQVTIHNGDSVSVLKELLPTLKGNTIFWLDAHFPGADLHERGYNDEEDEVKRIPLEHEIKLISKRCGKYKDVIIIDDAWLYIDADFAWGSFDDHMSRHGFNVTREEVGAGNGADFIYECFEDTHDIMVYNNHQGYFFLTPKEDE